MVLSLVIIPTNPNDVFGIVGICLEIAGFAMAFFAIKPKPNSSGAGSKKSFTQKRFSEFYHETH